MSVLEFITLENNKDKNKQINKSKGRDMFKMVFFHVIFSCVEKENDFETVNNNDTIMWL